MSNDTQNGIGIHNEMREWRAHLNAERLTTQKNEQVEIVIDDALHIVIDQFGFDPANWLHGFAKHVSLEHKKKMLDAIADAVDSARKMLDRTITVEERTQLPPLDMTYAAHLIGFEPTGDSQ